VRALLLTLLAASSGHAGVEVDGAAKSFGLFMHHEFFEGSVVVDRLRLGARSWWGEHVSLEVAGDGVATVGQGGLASVTASGLTLGAPTALRLVDLREASTRGNTELHLDLDRAALGLAFDRFELRLGRQAISHGSGRFFPSSDVFAPFSGVALDTEYKAGVDAARLTVPLGARAEVEVYTVGHTDGVGEGVHLARGRLSVEGLDVSLLAGLTDDDPTAAIDLQGDLGGLGWYAEALSRGGLPRATVGATYHFAPGLTVTAEVHHNGESSDHPEATFPGRWYQGAGVTYELTPLLHPALTILHSLSDGSALLTGTLRWDAGQEVGVDLGALVGVGDDASGFGAAPDVYFASVRLYL